LSHPNILAIFDFGKQDGAVYAAMELLEGETLRSRLAGGAIGARKAVEIGAQIAQGLAAAHDRGIVHRDLKPDNVFLTRDGAVKVLDFGLARHHPGAATENASQSPTVSRHTDPGTVMGTVGYMSPEQVRGLSVDHRSDLFSFGAVLYELLSGKKAFKRPTPSDTMAAILKEDPPELTSSGRNISPSLDRIVHHCLEKEPSNRFQSARDVEFALSDATGPTATGVHAFRPGAGRKWLFAAAAAVAAAVRGGILVTRRPHRGATAKPGVKRLAVLPFENLGAPEDDYFADGIADAVRGKLTSVPGLEVIARGSSTPYKKTQKKLKQIAQELEVGYLLTATVRWQKGAGVSNRVEVMPELVEVRDSGARRRPGSRRSTRR